MSLPEMYRSDANRAFPCPFPEALFGRGARARARQSLRYLHAALPGSSSSRSRCAVAILLRKA